MINKFLPGIKQRMLGHGPAVLPLLFLLICFIAFVLLGQPGGGRSADAADAGLSVVTDKSLYHPDDTVTFNISLDSGGQPLSGDLVLMVYPAASPGAENPISGQPLSQLSIRKNYSIAGQTSLSFSAPVKDLKVGTGGYPVHVSLTGGAGEQLGATAWLAVVDPGAHKPIDLVLLWTVSAPPERNPAGEFINTTTLSRCQASSSTPDSLLQHRDIQQKYPNVKTTYAVEPALLEQLSAMAGGFEVRSGGDLKTYPAGAPETATAAGCLDSLRQLAVADNTEILSAPYAFADLPLLAKQGWEDGNGQYRIGHDVLGDQLQLLQAPLGAYAPGLEVTTDSLRYLAATGGEYTVLPGSFRAAVQSSPDVAGAVSYRLRDLSGERITAFFAADDASTELFGGQPDPAAFFAALANLYNTGGTGGLVIAASASLNPAISAAQRDQVYGVISGEPWLKTITLQEAKQKYRPSTEPVTLLKYLDPVSGYVSQTYYQKLDAAHGLYEAYRAAVDSDEPTMMSLSRKMFTAETGYWAAPGARPDDVNNGLPYLEDIIAITHAEFSKITVSVGLPLLQGSGDGEATVQVKNGSVYPLTADIVFEAGNVNFPQGGQQRITLQPGITEIQVPYEGAGWSRLKASVQSQGQVLADDSATIHPISGRAWIVIAIAVAALLIGTGYVFLVVRRR